MSKNINDIFSSEEFRNNMIQLREETQDSYQEYTNNISTSDMAASAEVCAFISALMHLFTPKSVLNLGSGFSSYIIRKTALTTKTPYVVCVDDDTEWLSKTRNFLHDKKLTDNNLLSWNEFVMSEHWGQFDLVLHDIGNMDTRTAILPLLSQLISVKDGIAIIDDVHKTKYRHSVESAFSGPQWILGNHKEITLDRYNRYAWSISRSI